MECKDIREKLSAYLEGSVSPEERRLIEEHLNSCQECGNNLADLKKAGELVKDLAEVEPPAWLTQKIMSRVRAEGERKKGIFQKLFYPLHIKVPIQALATVFVAVIAVYVFRAVEPEMKLAHLPAPTEPMITRKEAPQPSKETRERKKLAAAPMVKESAVVKPGPVDLTVRVKDVRIAGREVENFLVQLGARKIKREFSEEKEVLTAELNALKAKEFLEKLKAIGEIKEKGMPLDISEGDIAIRVEIVSIP
jgi:hypothetical protein